MVKNILCLYNFIMFFYSSLYVFPPMTTLFDDSSVHLNALTRTPHPPTNSPAHARHMIESTEARSCLAGKGERGQGAIPQPLPHPLPRPILLFHRFRYMPK